MERVHERIHLWVILEEGQGAPLLCRCASIARRLALRRRCRCDGRLLGCADALIELLLRRGGPPTAIAPRLAQLALAGRWPWLLLREGARLPQRRRFRRSRLWLQRDRSRHVAFARLFERNLERVGQRGRLPCETGGRTLGLWL